MEAAEATAKSAIIKISENEVTVSECPNVCNWSQEKAIHDWENEGGALGMPGSSSSTKEWCESEIFATSLHWESKGVPGPDAAVQGRHQAHDPAYPRCVNRGA